MNIRVKDGAILTSRDRRLLEALSIARVLDAQEVMAVAGFASLRRANRRLLKLLRAGLLRRWRVGTARGGVCAIYGLSPQGALHIGGSSQGLVQWSPDSLVVTSQFLAHQRAVNAVFIEAMFKPLPDGIACRGWQSFKAPLSPATPLIPDGYFEISRRAQPTRCL